jgi:hypothetical protein
MERTLQGGSPRLMKFFHGRTEVALNDDLTFYGSSNDNGGYAVLIG